ncbi:MAG: membrane protein insertase YidC [Salaquimonas sp.]
MDAQNKNTMLAIALSVMVLIGWQFFYVTPKLEAERRAAEIEAQRVQPTTPAAGETASGTPAATGELPSAGTLDNAAPSASQVPITASMTRENAIAASQRITFENKHVIGSINLNAGRVDDLRLKDQTVTIEKDSPLIALLNPSNADQAFFAEFGFIGNADTGDVPGPTTDWKASGSNTLSPGNPVTLEWTNGKNIAFRRVIELDNDFLFTFKDEIVNNSGNPISLSSYGRVTRFGKPTTPSVYVLHEGLVGVFGEDGLQEYDYSEIEDEKEYSGTTGGFYPDGWLGITDKYWGATLLPIGEFKPRFAYFDNGRPRYQTDTLSKPFTVAAGASNTITQRLFAGSKKQPVIDHYNDDLGLNKFDKLIDWGWFYWITKPLFIGMNWLYQQIGNFGVAILVTTVVIKLFLFPLANLSYASMAKMKKVQPEMARLKERAGDDRVKLQQDMMALYKKEKINPAAGCWPMLIQIPIFFALYKVIYVTIEMRHAPFFGWVQDLSAPDPTSIFNLFGLLPFDVPGFLLIGVWPLLMGITMFAQMQMNPAPPDPTQAMIFKWMPIVFTFMLATFPAGLVIYWAWNNLLSILQQGYIMRKNGVKIELWDNLKSMFGKKAPDPK